jgi:acylphosphatase
VNKIGDFEELIQKTIICLNEATIDYCIVGAIAASYYGTVRTTEDLDVIVDLKGKEEKKIEKLTNCLRKQKIDLIKKEMIQGLEEKSHITAFDTRNYFYRVDFKGVYTSIDRKTMDNKVKVNLLDNIEGWLTKPELQIVAKLQPGMGSEKDINDIKNILLNYRELIDMKLLEEVAREYQVWEDLEPLKREGENC